VNPYHYERVVSPGLDLSALSIHSSSIAGFPKEEDHGGMSSWGMDLDRDSHPWVDGDRGPPPGAIVAGSSGLGMGSSVPMGTPNAVPPPGSQVNNPR